MRKFVFATLLAGAAGGFILGGGPVTAAAAESHSSCYTFDSSGNIVLTANCSQTVVAKDGPPMQMQMPNPCTGDPGVVTLYVSHSIFHVNVNGALDVWVTGTQNGAATFTSADGGPDYTGHNTQWFGEQMNNRNQSGGDTINVQLTDPAGDTVSFHENDHITITPAGVVQTFNNPVVTCG